MNELISVRLDDPVNPIQAEFFLDSDPRQKPSQILVAKFTGTYRIGHNGAPDASFITSISRAYSLRLN